MTADKDFVTTIPVPEATKGPALPPGAKLGRYVVIDEIGCGGMGVVYAAHDPDLDRKVAVKLLHQASSGELLVREARALARLAHPNVVTVYDVGALDGHAFVAMELVEGESLRRWMGARPRAWREAVEVFLHAGRGLAAAHAAGLVHRDFKPENVLIGHDGRARVLDFGLVTDRPSGEGLSPAPEDAFPAPAGRSTETGAVVGTPAYMALEQMRSEEADARTDQWSYCVALWEAVYGERPFHGETMMELARAIAAGTLPAPPRDRGVPSFLRRVLARGLEARRDARHPSMDALIAALEAGLAREEARARLVGRRYERLSETPGSAVAGGERAVDRLTGAVVTLVRVLRARDDGGAPTPSDRLTLARTVRGLASLRHPNIASVLDLGFDDVGHPYFILDHRDVTGDAASDHTDASRLRLDPIAQILRALSYLHRHGFVHGAIAPEAILDAGPQIKLLPLGVEVAPERVHPAYAAPEVACGGAPSPAADLYATGVLAYELLASHHPFGGGPRADEPPDLTAIDPALAKVVGRLLEADPAARYASAEDALRALAAAGGPGLATDTEETRESFLKAAPLIGRDAEIARLSAALRDAEAGRGSAWLVDGESGVGKSRLLDEVRMLALAAGALVLRGQEEREGGIPYRLFRGPLRQLALDADLDDLEAGVLLPVVPDLARVLGRPVTPAPELDAPSTHARLRDVVGRVLSRQERPTVLLLEDLQWSRRDSLELTAALHPLARKRPLLLVATCRNDQRPQLREELAGMDLIDLARLPEGAIADLSAAMIGEAGRRPELVRLLARETEGNAFFVVEVVRALAEGAGGLHRIDAAALPEKVFSGGIRRVVERRLKQVPEEARALLRAAAVIGRAIDPELCAAIAPGVDVERWAARCVDAAVLEQTGDEHRFAHDKLREGVLAEMGDEDRRRLHGQVAEAIERAYPDAPDRYDALAYHFGEAGEEAKEARYAALAGELWALGYAAPEGVALLSRALSLHDRLGAATPDRVRLHWLLGEAHYSAGDFSKAIEHLTMALAVHGRRVPRTRAGWVVWALAGAGVQIVHRLLSRRPVEEGPRKGRLTDASKAAARLSQLHAFTLEGLKIVALSLFAANTADRAGHANGFALCVLGGAACAAGLSRIGRRYFDRGQTAARDQGDLAGLADGMMTESATLIGLGQSDRAREIAEDTIRVALQAGSVRLTSMAFGSRGICDYYPGRFSSMLDSYERAKERMTEHFGVLRFSVFYGISLALDRLGRAAEALREIEPCLAILPGDRMLRSLVLGQLAALYARAGRTDEALGCAEACGQCVRSGVEVPGVCPGALEGPAEAYVVCWRSAALGRRPDQAAIARRARLHLREVDAWARVWPVGRPMALVYRGQILWLSGKRRAAIEAWRRAARQAAKMGMPFYEGAARLELGRAGAPGSPERRQELGRARALFASCDAAHHVALVDEAARSGADADADARRALQTR